MPLGKGVSHKLLYSFIKHRYVKVVLYSMLYLCMLVWVFISITWYICTCLHEYFLYGMLYLYMLACVILSMACYICACLHEFFSLWHAIPAHACMNISLWHAVSAQACMSIYLYDMLHLHRLVCVFLYSMLYLHMLACVFLYGMLHLCMLAWVFLSKVESSHHNTFFKISKTLHCMIPALGGKQC